MSNPICLEEDGYVNVKIADADIRLDLWEVNNRLYEITRACQGKPSDEFHRKVVEYLQEMGYPEVSFRLADRFVRAITDRVKSLGNVDGAGSRPA